MSKVTFMVSLMVTLTLALALSGSAATYTVTTAADPGAGSLRAAITAANVNPGNDLIDFNILPPGPYTIIPSTPLPPLTDPAGVTIDGITQPGGADCGPNSPATANLLIEITGTLAGATPGLWILSDNNFIQGLVINHFQQDGILVEAGVANPTASQNGIRCCFIGTDRPGLADVGNGTNMATLYGGVRIKNVPGGIAYNNVVEECLVSGNYADGITVWGPQLPGDVGFNTVGFNYIGTDRTGTIDLGNDHDGVSLVEGTHDNGVFHNLISGNDYDGAGLAGFNNIPFGPPILTVTNFIHDNIIGLDINLNPLPNTMNGVAIGTYGPTAWGCADGNFIGPGNIIAENGMNGIYVWEDPVDNFNADNNLITQNSIYENGALGIDLHVPGVTPNDPGDVDVLANEEMNFPNVSAATEAAGVTTVSGTLNTPAPNTCIIEVFQCRLDPTGYGEGEIYLGSTSPDAAGNWTVAVTGLTVGDSVTATATDAVNNTSEFCLCRVVTSTTCCNGDGIRGNVDMITGAGGEIDVADLTYLVAYLFLGGPPPPCIPEANVDGLTGAGGPVDVADLTYLVAYLFAGGPAPVPC